MATSIPLTVDSPPDDRGFTAWQCPLCADGLGALATPDAHRDLARRFDVEVIELAA
jgi:hypothetical protein